MATGADGASDSPLRANPAKPDDPAERLPRGSSPADTLISPRLWKHAAVGFLCLLAWAAVLVCGDRADRAHTGLEQIIGLRAGKLTRFFSTVMLLAAGQLAFITLWYRSRSRKDFNGSYRVWLWAAMGWLTLCAFQATGAHWNLAAAALAGRPVAIWNGHLVVWLVPAAIAVVALYRLLLREMRDSRLSLWVFRLSAVAALGAGLAILFGPFVFNATLQLRVESGLSTLWHLLLAVAMLLQTRYVVHVTNEPPRSPIVRWSLPRPRLPRLHLRRKRSARETAHREESKPRARSKPARSLRTTATARPVSSPAPKPAVATDDDSDAKLEAVAAPVSKPAPALRPAPSAAPAARRIDAAHASSPPAKPHFVVQAATSRIDDDDGDPTDDADEFDDASDRSLSKKERRRLKKLERQKLRAR